MTATIGTNSYVDEAEATAYFGDKFGTDAWTTETDKNGALVSAAQHLDLMCDWYGSKSVSSQALAFPRTYPDADPVPQEIKDAQCEIALNIIKEQSTETTTGDALSELKAGSVTLKFKATGARNPLATDLVTDLLSFWGICGGGGTTRLVPIGRQ